MFASGRKLLEIKSVNVNVSGWLIVKGCLPAAFLSTGVQETGNITASIAATTKF